MDEQSMTNDKIITKVKKLLALASSANANEAQSAMLKAQELMVMNGLSMQDVSVEKLEKKEIIRGTADESKRLSWYTYELATVLADNFRCYYIITTYYDRKRAIRFVGLKSDVKMVIVVYEYAMIVLKSQVKNFRDRLKNKFRAAKTQLNALCNDFIRGFIHGIDMKFRNQVKQQQWGLVLVKDPEVEKYYADIKFSKRSRFSAISTADNDMAYESGFIKGQEFEMVSGAIES
jgi:hypothetical protein